MLFLLVIVRNLCNEARFSLKSHFTVKFIQISKCFNSGYLVNGLIETLSFLIWENVIIRT